MSDKKTGLDLLREPFPDHQVSHKPQPTCKKDEYDKLQKSTCAICGGYHPSAKTIHLSYVGHAALTDRLLDADPQWTWEPLALRDGLPAFDQSGGLWIKLTVCGVSRLGYGHAAASTYKEIGSREKEVIGDALRNAAMRFGAALELWHKGDLHKDEEPEIQDEPQKSAGEIYKELVLAFTDSIDVIKQGIAENNLSSAAEAWFELGDDVKGGLWKAPKNGGIFTTEERRVMQTKEFRESFYGTETK